MKNEAIGGDYMYKIKLIGVQYVVFKNGEKIKEFPTLKEAESYVDKLTIYPEKNRRNPKEMIIYD